MESRFVEVTIRFDRSRTMGDPKSIEEILKMCTFPYSEVKELRTFD